MQTINIFLASSSFGLKEEKSVFAELVEKKMSVPNGYKLQPYVWDQNENTISDPESPFQSRIDPHLESSDIVVFLFWDRLGTFTQGEFELACRLNKSVFILRKPYLVDDFDLSEEEQKNKNHLIAFLKALPEDKFIINKYENISDFKVKLTDNIQHYLKQQAGDDNTRQRITAEPPVYLEKLKITSPIPVNNLFVGRNDEIQSLKKTVDN